MDHYLEDFDITSIHKSNNDIFSGFQDLNDFVRVKRDFNVKMFHVNIRSLNKNLDSLKLVLNEIDCSYDFIVLTEIWKIVDVSMFQIPDYSLVYNNGSVNQNDGVVVYVRNDIKFKCHILLMVFWI